MPGGGGVVVAVVAPSRTSQQAPIASMADTTFSVPNLVTRGPLPKAPAMPPGGGMGGDMDF